MILLDTHLVSEPLRPVADACGTGWLGAQALETLLLSAFSGRLLPVEVLPIIWAAPKPMREPLPRLGHRGWPLPAPMAKSLPLPWPTA